MKKTKNPKIFCLKCLIIYQKITLKWGNVWVANKVITFQLPFKVVVTLLLSEKDLNVKKNIGANKCYICFGVLIAYSWVNVFF
jgi:hypothetical protein